MTFPPFPSNGETNWGNKMQTWSDAVETQKVQGPGMTLRRDTSAGTRVFLDQPGFPPTMIHGDTGWRDVTPSLPDRKMTAGQILIRRENATLLVLLKEVMFDAMPGPTLLTAFTSVAGMFPLSYDRCATKIYDPDLDSMDELIVYGGSTIYVRWQSRITPTGRSRTAPALIKPRSGLARLRISSATWPTTLPGTPATV